MDEKKLQEMQILEQRLQNLMMQRQAFQMELAETTAAISEVKSTGDDVFKIIGQLMIKSKKSKIMEELEGKQKILELRANSFEKQENLINGQLDKIRTEITKS